MGTWSLWNRYSLVMGRQCLPRRSPEWISRKGMNGETAHLTSQQVPLCALLVVVILVRKSRLKERVSIWPMESCTSVPTCWRRGTYRVGPLHPQVSCSQVQSNMHDNIQKDQVCTKHTHTPLWWFTERYSGCLHSLCMVLGIRSNLETMTGHRRVCVGCVTKPGASLSVSSCIGQDLQVKRRLVAALPCWSSGLCPVPSSFHLPLLSAWTMDVLKSRVRVID